MKRNDIITKLTEAGRNPHRLNKLTNDELREAMVAEAPKLAEIAQRKTALAQVQEQNRILREIKTRRQNAAAMKRAAYENQQRRAEVERLRVIARPLPPIPSGLPESDVRSISAMIDATARRVIAMAEKFRETGDAQFAKAANSARDTRDSLRSALNEMLGMKGVA